MSIGQLSERVEDRVREWGIVVEDTLETESSLVVFGRRGHQPVVLKVIRQRSDEWHCGAVLRAFGGRGTVRVYEQVEGAVLLERLNPGTPLAALALSGRDEEATETLAEVIQQMASPRETREAFTTVQDWGKGFQRYLASGDKRVSIDLAEQGRQLYTELCATQRHTRLLHGDLHHYNVLLDSARGWTAIDPKGVVGEIEYEVGASLRNPYEKPEVFTSPETVERRLRVYESRLKLDADRALAWAFAQAVLSVIWSVEDGFEVDAGNPCIILANTIRALLK